MTQLINNLADVNAKELLTSSEGEVPKATMLVVAKEFSQNVKTGCLYLTNMINQLEPIPTIAVEECEMVVDPDNKEYPTDFDTAVLILCYSEDNFRIVVIQFMGESPTIH